MAVDTASGNRAPGLVRQLRDALAHLYDYAYLQRHCLAESLPPQLLTGAHTRGQELRRILLDGVETLNPGPSAGLRAPERRSYAILFGLYVEERDQLEVADLLGISTRQLRRDRAAALETLAGIVNDRYLTTTEAEPIRTESARLGQARELVDLYDLTQGLLPLLSDMAHEKGVDLTSRVHTGLPHPFSNRTLLRQVLISLTSHALNVRNLARLSFEVRSKGSILSIGLRLKRRNGHVSGINEAATLERTLSFHSIEPLVEVLGGRLRQEALGGDEDRVSILLPSHKETLVLVVDDSVELFELFTRYVTGRPYRLEHASSADQALDFTRSVGPDLITVDLMMPRRDGWELIEALRADETAARTPVIVCSVLDEPELARSIGVQGYVKKPVGQLDLLRVLEEVSLKAQFGARNPGSPADN